MALNSNYSARASQIEAIMEYRGIVPAEETKLCETVNNIFRERFREAKRQLSSYNVDDPGAEAMQILTNDAAARIDSLRKPANAYPYVVALLELYIHHDTIRRYHEQYGWSRDLCLYLFVEAFNDMRRRGVVTATDLSFGFKVPAPKT